MNEFDIPIFKKTYELYRTFYSLRLTIPRQDRYAVWEKCETMLLTILENILRAGQTPKQEKLPLLEHASTELNLLRVFIRLAKDVKAIDTKKYIILEGYLDEIGRMLGGWMRFVKEK